MNRVKIVRRHEYGYLHLVGLRILHVLVNSFKLKELDKIVEDGECDDGEDVTKTIAHITLHHGEGLVTVDALLLTA